jgi:hypothetical protein
MVKATSKDQDSEWLGKGGAIAKDLWMSHLTNANIEIHNGNKPKEPTTNVGGIWTTENWN